MTVGVRRDSAGVLPMIRIVDNRNWHVFPRFSRIIPRDI